MHGSLNMTLKLVKIKPRLSSQPSLVENNNVVAACISGAFKLNATQYQVHRACDFLLLASNYPHHNYSYNATTVVVIVGAPVSSSEFFGKITIALFSSAFSRFPIKHQQLLNIVLLLCVWPALTNNPLSIFGLFLLRIGDINFEWLGKMLWSFYLRFLFASCMKPVFGKSGCKS